MLVNAAGVSPSQAPVEAILKVDLYGTAVLLEEVGKVIAEGGVGVTISSQSGHRMKQLTPEEDEQLAITPTEEQLETCGVSYFDYYLMHAQGKVNYEKYKKCRAYEVAQELKAEGKIRHVGLSFHDNAEYRAGNVLKFAKSITSLLWLWSLSRAEAL